MAKKKDTQDRTPDAVVDLERVGITNLKTLVKTVYNGKTYRFTPDVEITINLDKKRKGVHMSRLVESIAEVFEEEVEQPQGLLEELGKNVLMKLSKKHPFRRGQIVMDTEYMVHRKTPVTGKRTTEAHDIKVTVIKDGDDCTKEIKVSVMGSTSCPHAMEYAGVPHIQRAIGELIIEAPIESVVDIDTMIGCVERSFSSETYTLLKTMDEKHVVEKMHANPKFVEDVAREILTNAHDEFRNCMIRSRAVSLESIHKHDVVAEGSLKCAT